MPRLRAGNRSRRNRGLPAEAARAGAGALRDLDIADLDLAEANTVATLNRREDESPPPAPPSGAPTTWFPQELGLAIDRDATARPPGWPASLTGWEVRYYILSDRLLSTIWDARASFFRLRASLTARRFGERASVGTRTGQIVLPRASFLGGGTISSDRGIHVEGVSLLPALLVNTVLSELLVSADVRFQLDSMEKRLWFAWRATTSPTVSVVIAGAAGFDTSIELAAATPPTDSTSPIRLRVADEERGDRFLGTPSTRYFSRWALAPNGATAIAASPSVTISGVNAADEATWSVTRTGAQWGAGNGVGIAAISSAPPTMLLLSGNYLYLRGFTGDAVAITIEWAAAGSPSAPARDQLVWGRNDFLYSTPGISVTREGTAALYHRDYPIGAAGRLALRLADPMRVELLSSTGTVLATADATQADWMSKAVAFTGTLSGVTGTMGSLDVAVGDSAHLYISDFTPAVNQVRVSWPAAASMGAPHVFAFMASPSRETVAQRTARGANPMTTLSWTITGDPTSIAIAGVPLTNPGASGSVMVPTPTADRTWTLTASNANGMATATASYDYVRAAGIAAFTASPSAETAAERTARGANPMTTLSWRTTEATSWSLSQAVAGRADPTTIAITQVASGSVSVPTPTADTEWTLTASGPGGSATATASYDYTPTVNIASFTASPASETAAERTARGANPMTTLAWSATGVNNTGDRIAEGVAAAGYHFNTRNLLFVGYGKAASFDNLIRGRYYITSRAAISDPPVSITVDGRTYSVSQIRAGDVANPPRFGPEYASVSGVPSINSLNPSVVTVRLQSGTTITRSPRYAFALRQTLEDGAATTISLPRQTSQAGSASVPTPTQDATWELTATGADGTDTATATYDYGADG